MTDPLADLQRRAYGRPVSEADATAAQVELVRLRTPDAPRPPPAQPPAVASVPRSRKLLLAAAALAAAALATGIALAPRPSLDVFASPQHDVPVWPGADSTTDIRWLGGTDVWNVFAFKTTGGNVCLSAFAGGNSGGGSCTSIREFEANGLTLTTSAFVGTTSYLTVTWGPRGDAHLDDRPH